MIRCTFRLNGSGLSTLSCPGYGFFHAYSGEVGPHRNNPDSADVKDIGPLPPGQYYIVTRGTGGIGTHVSDFFGSVVSGSDRSVWFALYRNDNSIDDLTFIDQVKRGNFRLHPAGYKGVSHGCITLPSKDHFTILREALLNTPQIKISSTLNAFGTVQVY